MNKHIHKNKLSCYLLKILATECYTHTVFKSSISRRLKLLPDWHLGIVSGAHNTINRSSSYMSNPNGAELIENSLENIGGNLWPAHQAADATEPVPLLGNRYYHFFIRKIERNFFVWPKNLWRPRGYKKCPKKSLQWLWSWWWWRWGWWSSLLVTNPTMVRFCPLGICW